MMDGDILNIHLFNEQDAEVPKTENKKRIREISSVHRCNTSYAKGLIIFEIFDKFKRQKSYNIGGCYTDSKPDLWFYFTTTVCPQELYLINLFVCHRSTGGFALGISSTNSIIYDTINDQKFAKLKDSQTWYRFESSKTGQNHYVKTFSFNQDDYVRFQNTIMVIPISIKMELPFSLSWELIKTIQLEHNTKSILSPNKGTDFEIISADGNKFPVHKIEVSAHSSVLRELVKESGSSLLLDLSDTEVKFIIQCIYSDVKDITNQNITRLLEIAEKYKFQSISNMIKHQIEKQIDVTNAVEVAVLAKKYDLKSLQVKVFNFILKHPEVLNTDGWKRLNDVDLAKSLFEHKQINKDSASVEMI